MSVSEFTITMYSTDNSARRSSAEKSAQTAQERTRELFRAFIGKYIIGIAVIFTMLITLIFSVYATTQAKYIPSALILMVTLGIISYLLEKDGEQNG